MITFERIAFAALTVIMFFVTIFMGKILSPFHKEEIDPDNPIVNENGKPMEDSTDFLVTLLLRVAGMTLIIIFFSLFIRTFS